MRPSQPYSSMKRDIIWYVGILRHELENRIKNNYGDLAVTVTVTKFFKWQHTFFFSSQNDIHAENPSMVLKN